MNIHLEPPKYKKIDGIHEFEPKTKWQKFCQGFGKFLAKGLSGRWEFNFKIKF